MRRWKLFMPLLGLVLAGVLSVSTTGRASELETVNDELALTKAKLELVKAQQELSTLTTGEEQQLAAAKSLLDAKSALKKAKVSESLTTLSAFQEILGPQQALTKGGEVSAAEKRGPFLLWTKNGGARTLSEVGGHICAAVQKFAPEDSPKLILLPAGYLENSKLAMRLDKHMQVLEDAAQEMTNALKLEEIKEDKGLAPMFLPGAVGAAITAVSLAQYGLSAMSTLSKSLRTDRALAEEQGGKEHLFQTLLFRHPNCVKVVEPTDTEALLLGQAGEEYLKLQKPLLALRNTLGKWNAHKAGLEGEIAKKEALHAKAKAQKEKDSLTEQLKGQRTDLAKTLAFSGTAGAIKEFLDSATPDVVMLVAESKALAKKLGSHKGLVIDTWTQDIQVYADNAWAKSLRRSASVSAEYRVVDAAGQVAAAGFYGLTGPEQKIDWKEGEKVDLLNLKETMSEKSSKK